MSLILAFRDHPKLHRLAFRVLRMAVEERMNADPHNGGVSDEAFNERYLDFLKAFGFKDWVEAYHELPETYEELPAAAQVPDLPKPDDTRVKDVSMAMYQDPECYTGHVETEKWDAMARFCIRYAEAARAEERGRAESAIRLLNEIKLQDIAKALRIPLGTDIGPQILPAILAIQEAVKNLLEIYPRHPLYQFRLDRLAAAAKVDNEGEE